MSKKRLWQTGILTTALILCCCSILPLTVEGNINANQLETTQQIKTEGPCAGGVIPNEIAYGQKGALGRTVYLFYSDYNNILSAPNKISNSLPYYIHLAISTVKDSWKEGLMEEGKWYPPNDRQSATYELTFESNVNNQFKRTDKKLATYWYGPDTELCVDRSSPGDFGDGTFYKRRSGSKEQ